ncbi:MAG: sigma-70 family RNA polymerase sigma factor [Fimbriimonadaceae bacterium]|nr:sigma-70 family RNA polymerase sigma factor [Chthonomonadaceae bacterium]MCO5296341.1 sigma-70 family RNA polymerase sigma factor [Fimbriimonadaceae bacterium]
MTDLELAKRVAAGDEQAAEVFVRAHYPALFRLLRHLTRHREDAEDLAQQAFLTARRNIDRFRGGACLSTWLHRIAYNEFAQWKRKRRHTSPLSRDLPMWEPGYASCIDGEGLLAALATLPDKLRETFVMHEVEELKLRAIASILRVPIGTVKARLFYARRRLRTLLEQEPEVTEHAPQQALP